MKVIAIIACTLIVACAANSDRQWERFKAKFGKQYVGVESEGARKAIFMSNLERIRDHNKLYREGKETFYLGVNAYADLTEEEWAVRNGFRPELKTHNHLVFEADPSVSMANNTVDWRKKGYVTPIKDQGQCGSCWAFSATGSLEGQHFAKTGKLVSLSEQNLVDCSEKYGNYGCEGGLPDNAFKYVKANHGIDTEKSYPYTAEDGKCHFAANSIGAHDTSYVDVKTGDEEALAQASAKIGPISVGIDASSYKFQLYSGGVYYNSDCSSTQLDHGVLVVGYGQMTKGKGKSQDYWIVKNSWGTSWGMKGYIYMSRNRNNNCGIATLASYPIVPKSG